VGGRVVKDNALTGGTLARMSQLEPMMAEENKNADSYDGRDGDGAFFLVALPHPWLVSQVKTQCECVPLALVALHTLG